MTQALVLYGVVLPAAISGICLAAGWRAWSRQATPVAGGEWSGVAALSLGCISGALALWGWPGFPPKLAHGWLPFVAAVGLGAGLFESLWLWRSRARVVSWIVLALLAVGSALCPKRGLWTPAECVIWHGSLTAGAAAVHTGIDRLAAGRRGASLPLALWLWCAGAAGH